MEPRAAAGILEGAVQDVSFDPYYKWLGIPHVEQPPNHYRLLAITLFESDPDVIDAAADRQMTYLRQCATGAHVAESQKLLNEVAAARLCLLNSERRRVYDAELKQRLTSAAAIPAASETSRDASDKPATRAPQGHIWWQNPRVKIGGVSAAVLLIAAIPFFVPVNDGRIRVEIEDPQIAVAIEGTDIVFKQADQGKDVKVAAGDHTLVVRRGDFTFKTKKLALKNGEKANVKVVMLIGQVEVRQGKKLLGRGKLPPFWQGWPADAPAPAVASFDTKHAKDQQAAWAKYLQVPVEYRNTLGMKFVLIPPGEFTRGSAPEEIEAALKGANEDGDKVWHEYFKCEAPPHKVILTQPIYLGVQEVTQKDYEAVMGANPSHFAPTGAGKEEVAGGVDTPTHPVEKVSWNDAAEFCAKLSQQENRKPFYFRDGETVTLLEGTGYRLPTEAEWEFACRAGTTAWRWCGDQDDDLPQAGWIGVNSGGRTNAAGRLNSNPFGLYDVYGNVWEWMQDWWDAASYGQFQETPAINPNGPPSGLRRAVRGGCWLDRPCYCRSSARLAYLPTNRFNHIGFRLGLAVDAVKAAIAERKTKPARVKTGWHGWPADAPVPAIAPFDAIQARKHQEEWAKYLQVDVEYTNSLGMKFVLIPPGSFLMGSTQAEVEDSLTLILPNDKYWQERVKSETPKHEVILPQPLYLGVHEVTQKDYQAVMGANPSHFATTGAGKDVVGGLDTSSHPVEMVAWSDTADFCVKLSEREKLKPFYHREGETVKLLGGTGYRIPTEAEWEFSCRAGTTTKYWIGVREEDLVQAAWLGINSGGRTHAVGELKRNPFGVYDIHGNVTELVQDCWERSTTDQSQENYAPNANGPSSAGSRAVGIRVERRGGNWRLSGNHCRVSFQGDFKTAPPGPGLGFRLALVATEPRPVPP